LIVRGHGTWQYQQAALGPGCKRTEGSFDLHGSPHCCPQRQIATRLHQPVTDYLRKQSTVARSMRGAWGRK
jgi:hypothetical protein